MRRFYRPFYVGSASKRRNYAYIHEIIGQLGFGQIIDPIVKISPRATHAVRIQRYGFRLHAGELQAVEKPLIVLFEMGWNLLCWISLVHLLHPRGKVRKIPFGVRMNYVIESRCRGAFLRDSGFVHPALKRDCAKARSPLPLRYASSGG